MAEKTSKTTRVAVSKTYKLYIGGKFPRTESGRFVAFEDGKGNVIANICRASRKDFRNAMVAARAAQGAWSASNAYLRGQILYRIAEMLEGRAAQFREELRQEGRSEAKAEAEVDAAIDRLIHYAGWADKYMQVLSSVNPVASSHFNFSMPEPTGVVSIIAPEKYGLLGLVSVIAPVIAGGNTAVVLASASHPMTAISFAEVLHASDVPAGVVNLLTGRIDELLEQFAGHMDANALLLAGGDEGDRAAAQNAGADNIKRVVDMTQCQWADAATAGVYHIGAFQETKTTWHPVAN